MTQNNLYSVATRAFLTTIANLIAIVIASLCFIFMAACWQICPAHGAALNTVSMNIVQMRTAAADTINVDGFCGTVMRDEVLPLPRQTEKFSSASSNHDDNTWRILFAIPRHVDVTSKSSEQIVDGWDMSEREMLRCRSVAAIADARVDQILSPIGMKCEAEVIEIESVVMNSATISKHSRQTAADLNFNGDFDAVVFLPYYTYERLNDYSSIYGVCHYTWRQEEV